MSLESWNRRYAAGEKLDQTHAPLVERFSSGLPPGDALDLACGPGPNALYLAELGWRVTAVDGSPIAIDDLRERARAKRLAIDIHCADLERGEFAIPAESYDLVLDIRYLQRDLIPAMQRGLRPGGMVIATVLVSQSATATRARPGELRARFAGWNILHYSENEGTNPIAEMVAVKPKISACSDTR